MSLSLQNNFKIFEEFLEGYDNIFPTYMLSTDSKIGHYTVISAIGAGGMGKVFLVLDTELNRQAAIKILNDAQSKEADILRRFKQEARAASALNHPNIVTIYEIGELNEKQHFIAMEFVEGETLRNLLKNRKLKLEDALNIAIQTVSALSAAHGAGIVHRDIKPENIMRRPDGLVKVLDFGLAKQTNILFAAEDVDPDALTQEYHITIPGMIMGTAAYMSPEQARGKQTDERTDLWSFGVVLYEMITGCAPFTGETKSDVMASILKNDPENISLHAPDIPIEIDQIIKKALHKDREERYQNANDLLQDLKIVESELNASNKSIGVGLLSSGILAVKQRETEILTAPAFIPSYRRWLWLGVPAALLFAGLLFGWSMWQRWQRTEINLASLIPSQVTSWKSDLGEDNSNRAKFSPDGKLIAFVATKNGKNSIWLKQIGGGDAFTRQQDEANDRTPVWSPDGGTIAYFSDRSGKQGIWTTPALGGSPTLLTPVEGYGQLIMWSKDGKTLYFELRQNLYTLSVASKQITKLTNFDQSVPLSHDFSISPDERQMIYVDKKDGQKDLWKSGLQGENPIRLNDDEYEDGKPVWHPDGKRVIYNSNRSGVKQICLAFLNEKSNIQLTFSDSDNNVSDISADGSKILYQSAKDDLDLWRAGIDGGREFQLTSDIGVEFWQDVTPNGETLVYQGIRRTSVDDKLFNGLVLAQKISDDNQRIELTSDGYSPRWSPDGKQIAFLRLVSGKINLWLTSAIGGDARAVTQSGLVLEGFSVLPLNRWQKNYQWSPDSRSLIYVANRNEFSNLWQVPIDGTGEKQLTDNEDKKLLFFNPLISPDGNKIAWTTMFIDAENKRHWGIEMLAEGKTTRIYQSDSALNLISWNSSGNELIFKSIERNSEIQNLPLDINIFRIASESDAPHLLSTIKDGYFYNIQISPDGKSLAFAARQNGNSVIGLMPLMGGTAKTLVSSNDTRVYFSNLSFAPDGKTIYYGKQANWQVISMISNFK